MASATYQGAFALDPFFPAVIDKGGSTYDPDTLYVTDGKTLKVTKNHGQSWAVRTPPLLAGATIVHVGIDPRARDIAYVAIKGLAGPGLSRVYKTTNGGQAWSDISQGLPDESAGKIVVDAPTGDLYLSTDTGVWRLRAAGAVWEKLADV